MLTPYLPPELLNLFDAGRLIDLIWAGFVLALGFVVARLARRLIRFLPETTMDQPYRLLFQRFLFWGIWALFWMVALHQMGLNLGVLLGAAGVFSVALGFAAQTSVSNLISGLFLMGERSFKVGDLLKHGEHIGEVLSIDLFSIKLKTFDNLLVRVPNESLIKSSFVNYSALPLRRFDLDVGVAYKENLPQVIEVLDRVARENQHCLAEPEPIVIFIGFGASSVDLRYCVWAPSEEYLKLRNSFALEVKEALDQAGIEIPFPHRTLYTGSQTQPLPVQLTHRD